MVACSVSARRPGARDRGRDHERVGTASAFAERIIGGYYLEIEPERPQLARYGLSVGDVQQVIASALSAETATTTVEGRERYAVSLRYPRDVRSNQQVAVGEFALPQIAWRFGSVVVPARVRSASSCCAT